MISGIHKFLSILHLVAEVVLYIFGQFIGPVQTSLYFILIPNCSFIAVTCTGMATPAFGQSTAAGPVPFGSPGTPVQGFSALAPSAFGKKITRTWFWFSSILPEVCSKKHSLCFFLNLRSCNGYSQQPGASLYWHVFCCWPGSPSTPSFSIGAGSKTSGARQRLQARRQHPRKK